MSEVSIFTRIRLGEVPGEIIYQNDHLFVIMTIQPHNPGHCLVIPVEQLTDLITCGPDVAERLMSAARHLMRLEQAIYNSPRVALVSAGLEVDHAHLHVFPLYENSDLSPAKAHSVAPGDLKDEADKLRAALNTDPIA